MKFNTIEEAIDEIKAGHMVIVVDDEDRENEGDLLMAAVKATPQHINFMVTHARGLVCMPMTGERLDELGIQLMIQENTEHHCTAFTVSVDAAKTKTGISAFERAMTVQALVDPQTKSSDLVHPGHIFPLRAREGGVLQRAGHTESAVDLARLAGLYPAGVICEILNDDGTMARTPQLMEFAARYQIKIITVKDLIQYRKEKEHFVTCVAQTVLPTKFGKFRLYAYESELDHACHVALVKGNVRGEQNVLVRVHSECLTGDVFGSLPAQYSQSSAPRKESVLR